MRIFEVLWLIAALVAFAMALYYIASGKGLAGEYLYLFLISGLCLLLAYIKRKSRLYILKRDADRKQAGRY